MGNMKINFEDQSHVEISLNTNTNQVRISMAGIESNGQSNIFRTTGCEISVDQFLQITSEINNLLQNK